MVPLYIKKVYYEEPSFRDSKVIFSVYGEGFKSTLSPDFTQQLMLKEITTEDISMKKNPVDYEKL